MFVLPDHSLLHKSPLTSVPKLADLKDSEQLLAIYQQDFIPFCNQHLPIIARKLIEYKINPDYSIDSGELSIRSAVREHDLKILEKLFDTFLAAKNQSGLGTDFRMRVLEVGAGYSYSREAENASAPWLARWLATRFPELEVIVSGTSRLFDRGLEKGTFNLADAIYLDCADLDRVVVTNCKFIFARQLFSAVSESQSTSDLSLQDCSLPKSQFRPDWRKSNPTSYEFGRPSVLEAIDQEDRRSEFGQNKEYQVKQNIMAIRNLEVPELKQELTSDELYLFLNRSLGFSGSAVINFNPGDEPLVIKFEELPTIINRSNILLAGIK